MTVNQTPESKPLKLSTFRYSLSPERQGALLRLETPEGFGYADLHPWPELGDAKLESELASLEAGKALRIGARSLSFARRDLAARVQKVSLFKGLEVPESHYTVTALDKLQAKDLDQAFQAGFRHLKIKVGLAPEAEVFKLVELMESITRFGLRLDFNERGTGKTTRDWLARLDSRLRRAIEFLEDPMPWHVQDWQTLRIEKKIPLALDRQVVLKSPADARDWLILKPARENTLAFSDVRDAKICVTSYLDHPVGQMCAALEAAELAKFGQVGVCGLLSHVVYAPNDFSRALKVDNARLMPFVDDVGIGFTALLERLAWKPLGQG